MHLHSKENANALLSVNSGKAPTCAVPSKLTDRATAVAAVAVQSGADAETVAVVIACRTTELTVDRKGG